MKRYLVFAGDNYYPRADCQDFVDAFDDLEEAKRCGAARVRAGQDDWYCVFDVAELTTVEASP